MKNLLIKFGSVLFLAAVMVLFVNVNANGQDTNKKVKKGAKTEMCQGQCGTACNAATCAKGATCDPTKCKDMACCKGGVCDPSKCKDMACCKDGKTCDKSACTGTCKGKK